MIFNATSVALEELELKKRFGKFMPLVDSYSNILSKGRNTKVGCFLIDEESRHTIVEGYNGAAIGCSADEHDDPRSLKPEKLNWTIHAELNAILWAARKGVSTNNSVCVVNYHPCHDCGNALVQAGIRKVITRIPTGEYLEKWKDHIDRCQRLFDEVGVTVVYVD